MYKFETRARHMYLETHPAYVNREEKSEQTEKKTTKRLSTGGASPLMLLFPTRVKISLVLKPILLIPSLRMNFSIQIFFCIHRFDLPNLMQIFINRTN